MDLVLQRFWGNYEELKWREFDPHWSSFEEWRGWNPEAKSVTALYIKLRGVPL